MGYRSTFITDVGSLHFPGWFIDKHKEHYNVSSSLPVSSKGESKSHYEIISDIQDVLDASDYDADVICICLWEDAAISRTILRRGKGFKQDEIPEPPVGHW